MTRITINDVDDYEKRQYQKWCVDHADGNMSAALRLFVQWIGEQQPTWNEVIEYLKGARDG